MKKVLKIIGIVVLVIIVLLIILLIALSLKPSVPENYTNTVKTGGDIETKYLKNGSYDVEYYEQSVMQNFKKYEIWYPSEMKTSDKKYPVIVVSNGTGVKASKCQSMFEHFASWGFIIIGTEEEYSWNGFSADMCLNFLIRSNENKESIFYQKIDSDNIGSVGHSQGGVGVFNSLTEIKNKNMFKCAVSESPTNVELANNLDWYYDISKVNVPMFMVAGTGNFDANTVIPIDKMNKLYDSLDVPKVMARHSDTDHGDILYSCDGYVTAWFMWQLKGDKEAAKAFIGNSPELMNNSMYQDQKINIE